MSSEPSKSGFEIKKYLTIKNIAIFILVLGTVSVGSYFIVKKVSSNTIDKTTTGGFTGDFETNITTPSTSEITIGVGNPSPSATNTPLTTTPRATTPAPTTPRATTPAPATPRATTPAPTTPRATTPAPTTPPPVITYGGWSQCYCGGFVWPENRYEEERSWRLRDVFANGQLIRREVQYDCPECS